ncbi:hypothetical protein OJ996_07400 [Luteolibacter sp. GHJ8]|uniref:Ig-like domain-containing protein n=1 Tax=Luteolibacter rhizosphaerae TaxID=2989719 RepID=A0ABT3G0P0_9BACT|nr:immunoglobulin domain-containing protein [Luteolibacter rhizosphaerae]MCW1913392.1 hypothetical protein [Luteolibacter rhizosphaerae]
MNTLLRAILSLGVLSFLAASAAAEEPVIFESARMYANFDGIHNGQFQTQAAPPSVSGGVGKQGILQVVNSVAAYYPKTGNESRTPLWHMSLTGAASAFPTSVSTFDPRAWYDPSADRFVMTILEIKNTAPKSSTLHLAVSKTGHPDGIINSGNRVFDPAEWHRYRYDLTRSGSLGGDFPTLTGDAGHLHVTLNFLEIADAALNRRFIGGIQQAGIFVFDKPALYGGVGAAPDGSAPPPAPQTYFPSSTDGSIQPAMQRWETLAPGWWNHAWFSSLDQDAVDTFLDSYFISYPGGTGFATDDDQTALDDVAMGDPVPQPGGAPPIGVEWDRLSSVAREQGEMIAAFTGEWHQGYPVVHTAALRPLTGETTLLAATHHDQGFLPTIASGYDRFCMVYTHADAGDNPTTKMALVRRVNSETGFTTPVTTTLMRSAVPYFGDLVPGESYTRWARYAHVSQDPVDQTFWICYPYARGTGPNQWGTRWFNVTTLTNPATADIPEFTKHPYVTAQADPTPQNGTLLPQGETGLPVRTIKVPQGYQASLNVEVVKKISRDPWIALVTWLKNGVVIPNLYDQRLNFPSVTLADQGYYQVVAKNEVGELIYSEEIFLDVVVPPSATIAQNKLRLYPGANGYLEVIPNPAQLAEMDELAYSWNRSGGTDVLSGKVKAFLGINSAAGAAAVDGYWTCTVANLACSTQVSAEVIAGPRINNGPLVPGNGQVLGPSLELSVEATGIHNAGGSTTTRPDFPGYEATQWRQAVATGIHSVTWRKDGVPLPIGGRFTTSGSAASDTWRLFIANPDYEDEGLYDCIVTDIWGAGRAVTSGKRELLLNPLAPPYITILKGQGPEQRTNSGMVYDSRRKRTVIFGGEAFGYSPRSTFNTPMHFTSNDTWEWDGKVWLKRNPANRPPPMSSFGIAYDSIRGRTVVFGGYKDTPPNYQPGYEVIHNDVWEWDGNDWTKITPPSSPPARLNPIMCFDSIRGEVLMLGGGNFNPEPSDYYGARKTLWGWNGSQWTQRGVLPNGNQSPFVSGFNAFGFDPVRGVAVLFGHFDDTSYPVWEWNGSAWNKIVPPLALRVVDSRYAAFPFYDPVRRRIGLPIITNNLFPPSSQSIPVVVWWDGASFIRGDTSTIDDINNTVITNAEGGPTGQISDMAAFDADRRCLVWHDLQGFLNTGAAYTREMHFSAKVKHLHQPAEVSFAPNGTLQLRSINAGLRPLTYQWYRNGVLITDGGHFSGATTATLTITGATAADAGIYTVRVTNAGNQIDTPQIHVVVQGNGLAIESQGNNLVLTWPGTNGILETSTTLTGTWTPLYGATSPYPISKDEPRRFFRVRYP